MALTSVHIYKSSLVNKEELKNKLKNYKKEEELESLRQVLVSPRVIEDISEFEELADGVRFKFNYDLVNSVPYRNNTSQYYLTTHSVEVRILQYNQNDETSETYYFIYASKGASNYVAARLSRIIFGTDNIIKKIKISPLKLKDIKDRDGSTVKFGWWEGIETHTPKAALNGDLNNSPYYKEFDQRGDPTLAIFESRNLGSTIMISAKGSLVLYGEVSRDAVERYITTFIIP